MSRSASSESGNHNSRGPYPILAPGHDFAHAARHRIGVDHALDCSPAICLIGPRECPGGPECCLAVATEVDGPPFVGKFKSLSYILSPCGLGGVGAGSAWLVGPAFRPRNHDRGRMALAQETVWNWNQRSRFSRSPVTQ
jgi:hypothetical protein